MIETRHSFCDRFFFLLVVNTKVDLRFHVLSAQWIPEDVRHKILERVLLLGFACTNFWLEQKFFSVVVEFLEQSAKRQNL